MGIMMRNRIMDVGIKKGSLIILNDAQLAEFLKAKNLEMT